MFDYPMEIATDLYVSKVGGFSPELERNEIGININAIYSNTSIIANETYAKIRFLGKTVRPYFFRKNYLIIGLEPNMEGYELSKNGEVVLPENMKEYDLIGREIIINIVETFMKFDIYSVVRKCLENQKEGRKRL